MEFVKNAAIFTKIKPKTGNLGLISLKIALFRLNLSKIEQNKPDLRVFRAKGPFLFLIFWGS